MNRITAFYRCAPRYVHGRGCLSVSPLAGIGIINLLQRVTCLILLLSGLAGCSDMWQNWPAKSQNHALDVPLPADAQRLAMQNEEEEQYLAALDYWKHAEGAISARISALSRHLKNISDEHVQKGITLFENKKGREAFRQFLEALRHDPSNVIALDYVKNRYQAGRYIRYTVEKDDSLIKIAERVYGSSTYDFAIILFSDINRKKKVVEGSTLSLAELDSFYSPVLLDYRKNIGTARKLFKTEHYEEAVNLAATILEDNPGDEEASYIANMSRLRYAETLQAEGSYDKAIALLNQVSPAFKNVQKDIVEINRQQKEHKAREAFGANRALFLQGKKLYAEGRYIAALNSYSRIDGSYQGLDSAVEQVTEQLKIQSEIHYKQGVKFFVEEDLSAAISEWETTIQFDPGNSEALNAIEKARDLLRKVKEIH